LQSFKVIIEFK